MTTNTEKCPGRLSFGCKAVLTMCTFWLISTNGFASDGRITPTVRTYVKQVVNEKLCKNYA